MANPLYANLQGNFKKRYGPWIDALPDDHTLADTGPFVSREMRSGLDYNIPVLTGLELGQTANVDNSAFTINPSVGTTIATATLDGGTILTTADLSYDTIFKGLNGAGNGNGGSAFKNTLDLTVEGLVRGAALYRELALGYGPGTSAAVASNIGVVNASISGANLAAPQVVTLTVASWIPGLWIVATNMPVDIYQADGTTPRDGAATPASPIVVQGMTSPSQTRLQLFRSGSAAVVATNDVIVPIGWRTKSCFGLEAIYNNATTLFGINAATVMPWRCVVIPVGGVLTRGMILGAGARMAINGVRDGMTLMASPYTFADLAEEASALRRWTDSSTAREQGASTLTYDTPAGTITVKVWNFSKAGQAFLIAKAADNFVRVGSTDNTMRPIGGGAEGFFTNSTTIAGAQMKCYSNQAPLFQKPYWNALMNGIVNTPSRSGVPLAN